MREFDGAGEVKPVRRYLGPRFELANGDAGLYGAAGVRAVDGLHCIDDQLGLEGRPEAELCHILDKRLDASLHQATGAL